MLETTGDIWEFHAKGFYVVVPTNVGWTKVGKNVMGRGVALQAALRFPILPVWYGEYCKERGKDTNVVIRIVHRLVLFPVKPLNEKEPYLSWKQDASLDLIGRSAQALPCLCSEAQVAKIALPVVGCGNGNLKEEDVLPVLKKHLDDRFTLVRLPEGRGDRR